MKRSVSNLGALMALLSGLSFGTSGSFAASLIAAGWTPGAAVTVRVALAALLLTGPALYVTHRRSVPWRALWSILAYGLVAVACTQLFYFNAVARLPVAIALMVQFGVGILLVVIWGWARHGHRPRRLTLVASLTALGGLAMVLNLVGVHHVDIEGVLWAIGAAVGLATYFVLSADTELAVSPLVIAWGGFTVGAVVLSLEGAARFLPMRATTTDVVLAGRHVSWLIPVLGLSLVACVAAYLSGIAAVRLLGSKLASFFGLIEVLAAVALAWLLVGQQLQLVQFVGGVLVVGGIALVRYDEMRPHGADVGSDALGKSIDSVSIVAWEAAAESGPP
ncbi:MAG: EamA family transporter [Candidatus Dormibacteria bacterium]